MTVSAQPSAQPQTPVTDQPAQEAPDTKSSAAPETAPKKEQDDLSARFAALSRQEKKIADERRRAKELQDKYTPLDDAISRKDALSLLKASGFSLNDVIDAALKADQPPTVEDKLKTVEERLAAWEKAKEEEKAQDEQKRRQENAQAEISAFREALTQHLAGDPDKYELINSSEAIENVYDACFELIKADPESYPTRDEAIALIPKVAEMIENELGERLKKLGSAKKLKTLLGLSDAPVTDPATATQPKSATTATLSEPAKPASPAKQDVTLTNRNTVNPAQPETRPKRMTREESLARAAAFLEQQLKAQSQAGKNPAV